MAVKHLGRFKATDAYGTVAPRRPAVKPRDQQDPEAGTLLCRVAQHGGTFHRKRAWEEKTGPHV
jgi:hypothetical protein